MNIKNAIGDAVAAMTGQLHEVYHNDDFQITGISVSKTGRLFVNFPRWSDLYINAVVEVLPDGSIRPYPDEEWNRWNLKPGTAKDHFVCVQSVVVDETDALWVLDPAAPMLATVVPGGPKLVKIDLQTNEVTRVISFEPSVAKADTYLNDVRFDTKRGAAYITDSGAGGLIVVDLESGRARRLLDGHPSVMVVAGVEVPVNGKPLRQNGKPPQFAADGIALSPDSDYLYYKAVTANALYRIKTEVLRDANLSPDEVASGVEKVAETFPTDGLWFDERGNLYLSDVTHNAVSVLTPDGKLRQAITDARLQWPDTFTGGPDGAIYISASHINDSPPYNEGKSVRSRPYGVFKFMPTDVDSLNVN